MSSLLSLPRELTVYTVGELHGRCLEALSAWSAPPEDALEVDAAEVEEVDAAGLQWLLSLSYGAAGEGREFALAEPSTALRRACEALGMNDWLRACAVDPSPGGRGSMSASFGGMA